MKTFWMTIGLALLLGCSDDSRATHADCIEIFDRLVEIELHEKGYRDPALLERRQRELQQLLRSEIGACVGRRLPEGALACVREAATNEKVSHICLRP